MFPATLQRSARCLEFDLQQLVNGSIPSAVSGGAANVAAERLLHAVQKATTARTSSQRLLDTQCLELLLQVTWQLQRHYQDGAAADRPRIEQLLTPAVRSITCLVSYGFPACAKRLCASKHSGALLELLVMLPLPSQPWSISSSSVSSQPAVQLLWAMVDAAGVLHPDMPTTSNRIQDVVEVLVHLWNFEEGWTPSACSLVRSLASIAAHAQWQGVVRRRVPVGAFTQRVGCDAVVANTPQISAEPALQLLSHILQPPALLSAAELAACTTWLAALMCRWRDLGANLVPAQLACVHAAAQAAMREAGSTTVVGTSTSAAGPRHAVTTFFSDMVPALVQLAMQTTPLISAVELVGMAAGSGSGGMRPAHSPGSFLSGGFAQLDGFLSRVQRTGSSQTVAVLSAADAAEMVQKMPRGAWEEAAAVALRVLHQLCAFPRYLQALTDAHRLQQLCQAADKFTGAPLKEFCHLAFILAASAHTATQAAVRQAGLAGPLVKVLETSSSEVACVATAALLRLATASGQGMVAVQRACQPVNLQKLLEAAHEDAARAARLVQAQPQPAVILQPMPPAEHRGRYRAASTGAATLWYARAAGSTSSEASTHIRLGSRTHSLGSGAAGKGAAADGVPLLDMALCSGCPDAALPGLVEQLIQVTHWQPWTTVSPDIPPAAPTPTAPTTAPSGYTTTSHQHQGSRYGPAALQHRTQHPIVSLTQGLDVDLPTTSKPDQKPAAAAARSQGGTDPSGSSHHTYHQPRQPYSTTTATPAGHHPAQGQSHQRHSSPGWTHSMHTNTPLVGGHRGAAGNSTHAMQDRRRASLVETVSELLHPDGSSNGSTYPTTTSASTGMQHMMSEVGASSGHRPQQRPSLAPAQQTDGFSSFQGHGSGSAPGPGALQSSTQQVARSVHARSSVQSSKQGSAVARPASMMGSQDATAPLPKPSDEEGMVFESEVLVDGQPMKVQSVVRCMQVMGPDGKQRRSYSFEDRVCPNTSSSSASAHQTAGPTSRVSGPLPGSASSGTAHGASQSVNGVSELSGRSPGHAYQPGNLQLHSAQFASAPVMFPWKRSTGELQSHQPQQQGQQHQQHQHQQHQQQHQQQQHQQSKSLADNASGTGAGTTGFPAPARPDLHQQSAVQRSSSVAGPPHTMYSNPATVVLSESQQASAGGAGSSVQRLMSGPGGTWQQAKKQLVSTSLTAAHVPPGWSGEGSGQGSRYGAPGATHTQAAAAGANHASGLQHGHDRATGGSSATLDQLAGSAGRYLRYLRPTGYS